MFVYVLYYLFTLLYFIAGTKIILMSFSAKSYGLVSD